MALFPRIYQPATYSTASATLQRAPFASASQLTTLAPGGTPDEHQGVSPSRKVSRCKCSAAACPPWRAFSATLCRTAPNRTSAKPPAGNSDQPLPRFLPKQWRSKSVAGSPARAKSFCFPVHHHNPPGFHRSRSPDGKE